MNENYTQADEPVDNAPSDPGGMVRVDFWTACSANGIMVDLPALERLERYHDELLYWNTRVNLISRKDEHNVWERHILHSLCLLKYIEFPQRARVLDVGTGGGLPGIPLKCVRNDLKVTMVDSIKKKITATEMFAQHTGLKDIKAIAVRAEDMANTAHYRGAFDVIVSRAVARIDMLMDWVTPLLKPTGVCAFLKGGDLAEEIAEATAHHKGLKVHLIDIDMFGVPSFKADEKKIVVCRYA